MKKFLVWFILLLVIVSSGYTEGVKEVPITGSDWPLTIIHTNDNHSHLDVDYKGRYGAAKISYMAKQVRSVYDNVLFLNAGDAVMGTVFYTVFEGTADRDVMNMMDNDGQLEKNFY